MHVSGLYLELPSLIMQHAECRCRGVVEDAVLMGTPVVIVPERYVLARSVVAGRFVNAYCTTDWTLSLNFRARSVCAVPCLADARAVSSAQGLS